MEVEPQQVAAPDPNQVLYDMQQRILQLEAQVTAQNAAEATRTAADAARAAAAEAAAATATDTAAAGPTTTRALEEPRLQVAKIPTFDGGDNGTTVQAFLTQARARLLYNPSISLEEAKVRYVVGYLGGSAAEWFEPTLRNQLEKQGSNRDEETVKIFTDFDYFAKRLKETFGNPDEKRTAERQLQHLRQKGSASKYATEFQQVIAKTGWEDDDALMAAFYAGLKDDVKDELSKEERPELLSEFTTKAIKIDNRIYERRLEKTGGRQGGWTKPPGGRPYQQQKPRYQANSNKKREYRPTSSGQHAGPMDLDNIEKKRGFKCYNCGIEGHKAYDCRKPKKQRKGPVPESRTGKSDNRQIRMMTREDSQEAANATAEATKHKEVDWSQFHNSIVCYDEYCKECRTGGYAEGADFTDDVAIQEEKEDDHDKLSWTACHDDSCPTHRSDKEGSGWYPRKPKNKRKTTSTHKGAREAQGPTRDCEPGTGVANCHHLRCETHIYDKAAEYHEIRDEVYREGQQESAKGAYRRSRTAWQQKSQQSSQRSCQYSCEVWEHVYSVTEPLEDEDLLEQWQEITDILPQVYDSVENLEDNNSAQVTTRPRSNALAGEDDTEAEEAWYLPQRQDDPPSKNETRSL